MLLVDEVVSVADEHIITRSRIGEDNLFHLPGRGVPAYVGFEIMAQTISVYDGYQRSLSGEEPKLGFLLGCRKFDVTRDWFLDDEIVFTHARALLSAGQMRSFECRIEDSAGEEIASGAINVFRPDSLEGMLQEGART